MGPVHGDAEGLKNPMRRIFFSQKKLKPPTPSKIGTHHFVSLRITSYSCRATFASRKTVSCSKRKAAAVREASPSTKRASKNG